MTQMDLFNNEKLRNGNLLPRDGTVIYLGKVFTETEADHYLQLLFETIPWKNDEVQMFGKKIITARKMAWFGDAEFEYTYSKITKKAQLWTPELMLLKTRIEEKSGETFNSCLLNLYPSGKEGMGWHSDAEKDLKPNSTIASLSFGAVRKFEFRHKKTKRTVSIILEHGSALLMKDCTQTHWHHRLPTARHVESLRINLTFRNIEVNRN